MAEQTKSKPVWRRARVKIVEKKDKLILNLEVEDISGYGIMFIKPLDITYGNVNSEVWITESMYYLLTGIDTEGGSSNEG